MDDYLRFHTPNGYPSGIYKSTWDAHLFREYQDHLGYHIYLGRRRGIPAFSNKSPKQTTTKRQNLLGSIGDESFDQLRGRVPKYQSIYSLHEQVHTHIKNNG